MVFKRLENICFGETYMYMVYGTVDPPISFYDLFRRYYQKLIIPVKRQRACYSNVTFLVPPGIGKYYLKYCILRVLM